MKILSARKVGKSFTHPALVEVLRSVDLEVEKGETVAIIGASGEGKSTLLQILGTLETPTGGELEILGESMRRANLPRFRNNHIGFVFQSFHLLDDSSALDNVLLPATIGRRGGAGPRKRARALLERVGLAHRADFPVKLLSGGEKQRVAIARALCNDPDILFADEPSGNLDHETSAAIHDLLLDCVAQEGKSLIVVTHDMALAERCDKMYQLRNGELHPCLPISPNNLQK